MRRLLATADGVKARGDHVLGSPTLDEIVLHRQHEEALCCILMMVCETQCGSELGDVTVTIRERDFARLLAKPEP